MANDYKKALLSEIENRFGRLKRIPGSQSLFELAGGIRIYLRYSKIHGKGVAFFGLRLVDLTALEGHDSYICFFTDREEPLFIPYADFEGVIRQSPIASDGQYKAQLTYEPGTVEFYLPRVGHFNVDAFGGTETLAIAMCGANRELVPSLSHAQAQTLVGSIGSMKGYNIYVPPNNADLLDWSLVSPFRLVRSLPAYLEERSKFASEIDVIWIDHKRDTIAAAFEVEHSTPVYSGLLRFNDVMLASSAGSRFFVVSNESRRDLFVRQLQRPTFQRSGLCEVASFLDYDNVFNWHRRLAKIGGTP
ncbi:MAG: hypothetical protein PHQ05_09430 [Sterolibacterium sp.]|nr:hypothetical protein [Sterolibacterium sp.]